MRPGPPHTTTPPSRLQGTPMEQNLGLTHFWTHKQVPPGQTHQRKLVSSKHLQKQCGNNHGIMLIHLLNTFQDTLTKTGLIFISREQFVAIIFSYYFSKLLDLF